MPRQFGGETALGVGLGPQKLFATLFVGDHVVGVDAGASLRQHAVPSNVSLCGVPQKHCWQAPVVTSLISSSVISSGFPTPMLLVPAGLFFRGLYPPGNAVHRVLEPVIFFNSIWSTVCCGTNEIIQGA